MFPREIRFNLKDRIYNYTKNRSLDSISYVAPVNKGEILTGNPFIDFLLGESPKTTLVTEREEGEKRAGDREKGPADRGLSVKDRYEDAGEALTAGPVKEDKRRFARVKKLLRILYALQPEAGAEPFFKRAQASNISAGGMELEVGEYTGQGSRILLQFILPVNNSYQRLNILSVVTRTVPPEPGAGNYLVGVEFMDIKKSDHDIITRHIWANGK